MDDLITFVRARLDEDERRAHAGLQVGVRRHDHARVLRDEQAKRRTVALYKRNLQEYQEVRSGDPVRREYVHGIVEGLLEAVKDIASAWSDHPDYDAERWAP